MLPDPLSVLPDSRERSVTAIYVVALRYLQMIVKCAAATWPLEHSDRIGNRLSEISLRLASTSEYPFGYSNVLVGECSKPPTARARVRLNVPDGTALPLPLVAGPVHPRRENGRENAPVRVMPEHLVSHASLPARRGHPQQAAPVYTEALLVATRYQSGIEWQ